MGVLLGTVFAVWLLAGHLDFTCHRLQKIEQNAGLHEALLHGALLAPLGIALLAVLFLELTLAVLVVVFVACVAHELTTWIDLRYASSRRVIPWYEQCVHGVQQTLPWVSFVVLLLADPRHLAVLKGTPAEADAWTLRLRETPLSAGLIALVLASAAVFIGVPYLWELVRCRRHALAGDQLSLSTIPAPEERPLPR